MQYQRIGLHHIHGAAALVQRETIIQLHCADIRKEQDIRGDVAHLEGGRQFRPHHRRAHRAQAHRHARALRRDGQVPVYQPGFVGAARHTGNEQWAVQLPAKHLLAHVDALHIHFGQGLMNKAQFFQPGGRP